MEKRFISFGIIQQMPTVVKKVKLQEQFVGVDENGKAIYNNSLKAKLVTLTITEKIHGTNAAVCYSLEIDYIQSRKNIITPEKDNAGFAFWASQNQEYLEDIIQDLAEEYNIDLTENIVTLFGEWAGGSIQRNACVSGLDKSFFIFQHFKVSPLTPLSESDENIESAVWHETALKNSEGYKKWVDDKDHNIYNVMNFPHWNIELDFERPDIARNEIIDLVEKTIEPNSPLGCELGKEVFEGPFTIKDGKPSKPFSPIILETIKNLADGKYFLYL